MLLVISVLYLIVTIVLYSFVLKHLYPNDFKKQLSFMIVAIFVALCFLI